MYDEPASPFSLYLPEAQVEAIDRIAIAQRRSRSWMIAEAIRVFLASDVRSYLFGLEHERGEEDPA